MSLQWIKLVEHPLQWWIKSVLRPCSGLNQSSVLFSGGLNQSGIPIPLVIRSRDRNPRRRRRGNLCQILHYHLLHLDGQQCVSHFNLWGAKSQDMSISPNSEEKRPKWNKTSLCEYYLSLDTMNLGHNQCDHYQTA